jgi:hypothetical protein
MFRHMKLRIFDAKPKQMPRLSNNFSRQTRNFRCPGLHFLSFPDKLTIVEKFHTPGPMNLNGAKTVGTRSFLPTPQFRWHLLPKLFVPDKSPL